MTNFDPLYHHFTNWHDMVVAQSFYVQYSWAPSVLQKLILHVGNQNRALACITLRVLLLLQTSHILDDLPSAPLGH